MEHSGARFARLPPSVEPGDRIGVAALSGKVERAPLEAGVEALRGLGFEPVLAANVRHRHGVFAGADEERLAGFHDLAADPTIRAIFFARGGHGVLRLLPHLDWDLLARIPRAYVGYSDLTPFLLEVVRRLDLVTFHGPMVAVDLARGLAGGEVSVLLQALAGQVPPVPVEFVAGEADAVVEGPLLGGCLSLLAATLGTEFRPRLAGSILFWEDVSEPLYRLDRMIQHLRLAGALSGIRAMLVGNIEITDADSGGEDLPRWLAEVAGEVKVPMATNCSSGHCRPNRTLPLGASARLDMVRGELSFASDRRSG